jgi:hypothetical protein
VGRYINALEEAGLVEVQRTWEDKRPRSWISLTTAGREALAAHLESMSALIERFDSAAGERQKPGGAHREALAVLFAMSASTDYALAPTPTTEEGGGGIEGLKSAVLDDPPGEFTFLGGGPISRFFEFPRIPGLNERFSPSFERVQRIFLDRGLTGGYALGWAREASAASQVNVAARVFELASTDSAASVVDVVSWSDGLDTGVPGARTNVHKNADGSSMATAVFSVRHLVGMVIVFGIAEDLVEVARSCVRRQYDRMINADLGVTPVEP